MKYNWIEIKIKIHHNMTPTEKAIYRLFCHETYLTKNKELFATRSIQENCIPYLIKNLTAERKFKRSNHGRTKIQRRH